MLEALLVTACEGEVFLLCGQGLTSRLVAEWKEQIGVQRLAGLLQLLQAPEHSI